MARRDAASASAPRPVHHRMRAIQRSSSPIRAVWPSRVRRTSASRRVGERLLRRPGQVALEREPLQQVGARLGLGVVGHGERGAVVLGRLDVGPRGAGRARRGGGMGQDDVAVRGAPRVVHHARQVNPLPVEEGGQHHAVELAPAQRRQLRLDAGARDLVAEPHDLAVALQHPRGQARLEVLARGGEGGLDQPQLRAPRHHGDQLDHLPGPRSRGARPGRAPRRARCAAPPRRGHRRGPR